MLVGLFSIKYAEMLSPVVVPGPPSDIFVPAQPYTEEQIAWLVRAEADRTTELSRLRTAAKDWASTIAAVTGAVGIVALIKGPSELDKLTDGWKRGVAFVALLAVLAALRGTVLAAVAAQGGAQSFSFGYDPDEYRDRYREETIRAARELQISRILVVLATLAAVAAVGMLWFGDPKTKAASDVVVVTAKPVPKCGTAGFSTTGEITLTTDTGTFEYAPADVKALIPVAECPKPAK